MKREPKQVYTRKQHLTALRVAKWRMKKRHDSLINDANDRLKRMVETAISNRKNALQIVRLLNPDFSLGRIPLEHYPTDFFLNVIREEVTTLKEQIGEKEKTGRELIDGIFSLRQRIISIIMHFCPMRDVDKDETDLLQLIDKHIHDQIIQNRAYAAKIANQQADLDDLRANVNSQIGAIEELEEKLKIAEQSAEQAEKALDSERTKSGEIIDVQNKNLKSSLAIMQAHLDELNAAHSNKSIIQFIRDRREWRKVQAITRLPEYKFSKGTDAPKSGQVYMYDKAIEKFAPKEMP